MLIIRMDQMKRCSDYALQQFENRMVAHLRKAFPEKASRIPEADLRAVIREGIDKAEEYGITDEIDVRRYLEHSIGYGPDFDTRPDTAWAGTVLRNPELTGAEKMDQIDDHDLFVLRRGGS